MAVGLEGWQEVGADECRYTVEFSPEILRVVAVGREAAVGGVGRAVIVGYGAVGVSFESSFGAFASGGDFYFL
jgi:hypothetical protein